MPRTFAPLLVLLAAAGCSRGPAPKEYPLVGQIVAIAPERREVTIRHQDVPNYMPGMTMPFPVRDASLLDGKAPGDLVTATLVVGETDVHLSTLTRTGHQPLDAASAALPKQYLQPGDLVPDTPLVDQDGSPRSFADYRGHRVAVTFIYTRCPLPEFCPLMDRHFASIQRTLASRPDLRDVRLVTVTLDPAYDTPAVLKAHARALKADPAIWSSLSGDPAMVTAFAEQFGTYIERNGDDPSQIVHSLRTAVVGPEGRVVAIHSGNDWTPAQLLAEITAVPAATH